MKVSDAVIVILTQAHTTLNYCRCTILFKVNHVAIYSRQTPRDSVKAQLNVRMGKTHDLNDCDCAVVAL